MSLLAKAQPFQPAKPVAKGKSKKVEVEIVGLEDYAIVDALIKSLESVKETLGAVVKDAGRDEFLKADGTKRPENFRGTEGIAEASIELRKRSTKSALSDDEAAILDENEVPYAEEVTTEEAYVINPKYLTDSALLARIEKVKGLPEDFVLKQEKVSKKVVTDETIDYVFANKLAHELLDTVGVLAIKPKINKEDTEKTLKLVRSLLVNEKKGK